MIYEIDTKQFYLDLQQCISERKRYITKEEYGIIKKELTLFETILFQNPICSLEEIQAILVGNSLPLYSDIYECLQRIHEVSGVGSLPSCQSSANTVEALYDIGLITPHEVTDSLFIGRGHIAPAIFAIRYLKKGFPLSFLFSLYDLIPSVINKSWGFHYSMRHSLGEGLPMAVGKALIALKNNEKQHFFCFVGDGEMQEGISYEAIRLSYELDIKQFTLIIDANRRGIAKLNKPINLKYLNAYFDNVYVLANDKDTIKKQLLTCKQNGLRDAIVCNTKKTYHSYRREKKSNRTTSLEIGNILEKLKIKYFGEIYIFTPDLNSRFGLSEKTDYTNTGLSEQLTVGMLLSLDRQALKVILTDDKYLFNSIDILQSLFMNNSNVLVIASRKNAIWGGPNNSPNIFSNLYGVQYYEICNPKHFENIIFENKSNNANFFVLLWDDNLDKIQTIEQDYSLIDKNYLISKKKDSDILLISSESFAIKAHELHKYFQTSHIRFFTNKPFLTKQDIYMINKYKIIIVYEQNSEHNGLGVYLKSILLRNIYIISSNTYSLASTKKRQDKLSRVDIEELKRKTKGIINV